jgi:hypothetical protein
MSEVIKLSRRVFGEKAKASFATFHKTLWMSITSVIVALWIRGCLKTLLRDSLSSTSLILGLMRRSIDAIWKSFTNSSIQMESVFKMLSNGRRVWRYQRGNQNPYIEEEQTTQWPKISTKGQTTIYKTYI